MFTISEAQEERECVDEYTFVSSGVEPHVVSVGAPAVLCSQHKMDFQEVDCKQAWQTTLLLVTNNFTLYLEAALVYTQPSAPPGGAVHHPHSTPPEQNCSWKLVPRDKRIP